MPSIPDVPVYDIATMEQRVQDSMARQRFAMTMLAVSPALR
jgi:hypothetical protein